ncbi:hypothetical protein AMATHDRAFT_45877 [Amanita thiersii Skay4041]|uniref:N-acetyltransferase domain-containing protein n=1 Tax=Amanita thiersii Skay4041 TaxID=703135 RepID=A0A2A9NYF3_9AGAR|nr:hypothetical protein AMATHDRAFT_45877 [Amanita thiersii Skay4041]
MPPSFINSYKPPAGHNPSSDEPFDINFILPIPEVIETDRIKLALFIPSIHTEPYVSKHQQDPTLDRYLPIPSLNTLEQYNGFMYSFFQPDPTSVLFAIIDKTKIDPNASEKENLFKSIAGIIGVLHCSPNDRSVEFAPVIVLPEFQHTYVSKNAVGAMLKFWLDVPSQGGMGFRRAVWTCNPMNEASIRFAEKMGFKQEGIMRWVMVLPEDKQSKQVTGGERGAGDGRDSVLLAVCWDDWEGGVRERVQALIDA